MLGGNPIVFGDGRQVAFELGLGQNVIRRNLRIVEGPSAYPQVAFGVDIDIVHLDAPPRIHRRILFVEFGYFFIVFDDIHAFEVVAYVVAVVIVGVYDKTCDAAKHGCSVALFLFFLDRGIVCRGHCQGYIARYAAFDDVGMLGYPPNIADGDDALVVGHAEIGDINLIAGRIGAYERHVVARRSYGLNPVGQDGERRPGNIVVAKAFGSGSPNAIEAAVSGYFVVFQFIGNGMAIGHLTLAVKYHNFAGGEVVGRLWCNHDIAHDDIDAVFDLEFVRIPVYVIYNRLVVVAIDADSLRPDSHKRLDICAPKSNKLTYGVVSSGDRCTPQGVIVTHAFLHKHDDMVVYDGYAIHGLAEDTRLGHFVAAVVKYDQAEVGADINFPL